MSNPSANKRQKEKNRQDKQREKDAKRKMRRDEKANRPEGESSLDRAIAEVAHVTEHLLADLVTTAAPRDREVEAARARARAEKRFGRAA